MAAPARPPSFDVLGTWNQPWTAQMALDLLPENAGPKIEVFRGSVVVTPHAAFHRHAVRRELPFLLNRAARRAGMWAYAECNVDAGEDLFIPDFAVFRRSGRGQTAMPVSDAVLLGEIVPGGDRPVGVVDRRSAYAAAEVSFYLQVDVRDRIPTLILQALADGEYRPVAAAAAGESFVMTRPFDFLVRPESLADDEG